MRRKPGINSTRTIYYNFYQMHVKPLLQEYTTTRKCLDNPKFSIPLRKDARQAHTKDMLSSLDQSLFAEENLYLFSKIEQQATH